MRLAAAFSCVALAFPAALRAQDSHLLRPFGTLREQAAVQQEWLRQRMETVLPGLMRKHGVDMWVIPMREYNEDPVFSSIVSPTTFAARRRTIYVFFDRGPEAGVERLALGGTSQGGVYTAFRSQRAVAGTVPGNVQNARRAELDGDEQWLVLKDIIEQRKPARGPLPMGCRPGSTKGCGRGSVSPGSVASSRRRGWRSTSSHHACLTRKRRTNGFSASCGR
jgi:hypothetical protein